MAILPPQNMLERWIGSRNSIWSAGRPTRSTDAASWSNERSQARCSCAISRRFSRMRARWRRLSRARRDALVRSSGQPRIGRRPRTAAITVGGEIAVLPKLTCAHPDLNRQSPLPRRPYLPVKPSGVTVGCEATASDGSSILSAARVGAPGSSLRRHP